MEMIKIDEDDHKRHYSTARKHSLMNLRLLFMRTTRRKKRTNKKLVWHIINYAYTIYVYLVVYLKLMKVGLVKVYKTLENYHFIFIEMIKITWRFFGFYFFSFHFFLFNTVVDLHWSKKKWRIVCTISSFNRNLQVIIVIRSKNNVLQCKRSALQNRLEIIKRIWYLYYGLIVAGKHIHKLNIL